MSAGSPRYITFYLPQFYPTPENDAWWGPGFTEWSNVVKARPQFRGHEQPHLPANLGFYDLRLAETRSQQAALARAHGIHAFCYYHYWSVGARLLARPFDEVLASGEPDFPFMLCWANHDWTRAWDGYGGQLLAKQRYSPEDDLAHIRWMAGAFADPRYVTVAGRPVLPVLQAGLLEDARATTDRWRAETTRLGLSEPYMIRVDLHAADRGDPTAQGFDASIEYPPVSAYRTAPLLAPGWLPFHRRRTPSGRHAVISYPDVVDAALAAPPVPWKRYRCVVPRWDNSPRRKKEALILHGSTPAEYGRWVEGVTRSFRPFGVGEDFVFVNAWNEWGEGAHLEPDLRWGTRYLEAHRPRSAVAVTM
ncbi:MAG: glycoside hydrolase family 99-like domain-containing protein [Acidimicrobiales bacterium]